MLQETYKRFVAIAPSDTVDTPDFAQNARLTDAVYVGAAGDVTVAMPDNTTATFFGVPAGVMLQIGVRRVNGTFTTASNLLACYLA